jgi:poly(A) polymerase
LINALYADLETGEVFDYFGGVEDLRSGVVRFIGDAFLRIAEDHLRILRFFRFQARYGNGPPDLQSLSACRQRANDLMALSRERIADELLKLLDLPNPSGIIALMLEEGILKPVLPEIERHMALSLANLVSAETSAGIPHDKLRRLGSLLPAEIATVKAVATRLKLSNVARKRLEAMAARENRDGHDPKALAYWLGHQAAIDQLLLKGRSVAAIRDWTTPNFPLTGSAIVKRGIAPGPRVAALLKQAEMQWVEEGFPDTAQAEAILDAIVQNI